MAGIIRGKLEGAKELDAALAALDREVATKLGAKAVRTSASELHGALVEAAPYLPGDRVKQWKRSNGTVAQANYGHLRDNLKVRKVPKSKLRKPHFILYQVSTGNAFWGNFLEFGTRYILPRPWMKPVFDRLKGKLLEIMTDTLRLGIDRVAKRAARKARAMLPNGRND